MRTLTITSRPISLKDERQVHDEHGAPLFAAARTGIFKRDFALVDAQQHHCASLSPEPWRPEPAWQVSTSTDTYTIKRRKKSFERFYWVEGGEHDGVIIEGTEMDTRFRIRNGDHIIVEATIAPFSIRSSIELQLLDDTPANRLLAAIVGVIVSKERQARQNGRSS